MERPHGAAERPSANARGACPCRSSRKTITFAARTCHGPRRLRGVAHQLWPGRGPGRRLRHDGATRSHEGPALLANLLGESGRLRPDVAALVGDAWSDADLPEQCLDHDTWRELFKAAGTIVDGQPAPRPETPLTLWRGASAERRLGWAWTADRARAEWFANRSGLVGEPATVWQAEVEGWACSPRTTGGRKPSS